MFIDGLNQYWEHTDGSVVDGKYVSHTGFAQKVKE